MQCHMFFNPMTSADNSRAWGGRLLAFVRDSPPSRSGPKAPKGGGHWRGGFREGRWGGGGQSGGSVGGGSRWGNLGWWGGGGTRPWWLAVGG